MKILSNVFVAIFAMMADTSFAEDHSNFNSPNPMISELRFGVMSHDYRWREQGSKALQAELLFSPLKQNYTDNSFFSILLSPSPHVGASLNSGGKTSYLYGGLSWIVPIGDFFFVEGSFGGAIHNGKLNNVSIKHEPLGTRALFRETASVGIQIKRLKVMATIEHLSNAGIGNWNHGLTNFGTRIGFQY